jgi:hypothetical protein
MQITNKQIQAATIEAIYWWNRDEYYYNQYFCKLDIIYKDKELLAFFTQKIFETFLREYSIRRNISSGFASVDSFIKEIVSNKFVVQVKAGNTSIIDSVSGRLKNSGISTTKETKSLLSKVAFLINPNVFSLYDMQAKKALWALVKDSNTVYNKDLNNYSAFMTQIQKLKDNLKQQGCFAEAASLLKQYRKTEAYSFFSKNPNAFELRIVDKLLWLKGQSINIRKVDNEAYNNLLKL